MEQIISNRTYNVGVYCRLSRDDGTEGVSSSIQSQKEYIEEYVSKNNWNIVDYYFDDGFSGTNFNRPSFKRLLGDIESKKINCVITKDLSRLGRNYIQTGYYTEEYFPSKKIRYIAINDNFDTGSNLDNDFAPFKNIINEWYAKDISKKVKSSFAVKRQNGEMVAGQPLYGYYYEKGSTKRIIALEESKVVKLIFKKYISYKSVTKVANYLESNKIYSPKYSLYLRYHWFKELFASKPEKFKYHWTPDIVRIILKNKEYTGKIITNKTRMLSFKNHKSMKNDEESLIVCDGPRIISDELFTKANEILSGMKHLRKPLEEDKLKSLVRCPYCGNTMLYLKRSIRYKTGKEPMIYYGYGCMGHGCKTQVSKAKPLNEIIELELKNVFSLIINNKDMFLQLLEQKNNQSDDEPNVVDSIKLDKLKSIKSEMEKIDKKIEYLLTSRANNDIPASIYQNLMSKYGKEKEQLENNLNELVDGPKAEAQQEFDFVSYGRNIINYIEEHKDIIFLDTGIAHSIIESIMPKTKRCGVNGLVQTVITSVDIKYYKIDEIIKELEENKENRNIC